MVITVNIYYTGPAGRARAFVREMTESGVAADVRAERAASGTSARADRSQRSGGSCPFYGIASAI